MAIFLAMLSLLSAAPSHFAASAQSKGGDSLVMTNLSHVDCISCYLSVSITVSFNLSMSRILLEFMFEVWVMGLW